jgi:hypothetical protein
MSAVWRAWWKIDGPGPECRGKLFMNIHISELYYQYPVNNMLLQTLQFPLCWHFTLILQSHSHVDSYTLMLKCILMLTAVPLCWQLCPQVDSCALVLRTVFWCWQVCHVARCALMFTDVSLYWQLYLYVDSCALTLISIPSCWQLCHWQVCSDVDSCILMLSYALVLKVTPVCL